MPQALTFGTADSRKRLNAIFNVILLLLIGLSLGQLAEPMRKLIAVGRTFEYLELLVLFVSVLFVVNVYRQLGAVADSLLYWTQGIKSPRLALICTSLVLAILPVKGRTIISAPIIGQIARKQNLNSLPAAMVDFVATHIVYLLLPIEGSVVVVLATFASIGFGLSTFIGYMLPGIAVVVAAVAYYSWRSFPSSIEIPKGTANIADALKVSTPIVLLMGMLYLYEMHDVTYAILGGSLVFVGLTLMLLRPSVEQIRLAIKAMDKQLILTLALIFLFAGLAKQVPFVKDLAAGALQSSFTIPSLLAIGYLSGLLLGSSSGMASLVFPILAPLIVGWPNAFAVIASTYAALYAGYLVSPAHPCCHYAASYFDTPYLKVWIRGAVIGGLAAAAIIGVALIRG